jgi:hypothetical protein
MSSVREVTSQPYVPTVHWTLGGPRKDQKVPKRGEVVAGGLLDIRLIRRGRSGRRSTLFGIDRRSPRDGEALQTRENRAEEFTSSIRCDSQRFENEGRILPDFGRTLERR